MNSNSITNQNYQQQNSGGGETEKLISRFMNSGCDLGFRGFDEDKITPVNVTAETAAVGYGLPPHYPRRDAAGTSFRVLSSMDQINPKSNLLRQSSSPAGLFAHLSAAQNGYAATDEEVSPSTKRLKSHLSFPSRLSSSSSWGLILPQISETGSGSTPDDDENLGSSDGTDARIYSHGFTIGSWNGNEPSHFSENFQKGVDQDNDAKLLFSGPQNGDRFQPLSHHLSLPKTFSHINPVEKFLHFQDSVPCKIRAKRGCATHPRSIAERVRRTRISERMRKLQELVPNMDKQTNTSDMLDLAVDYIKDLQSQYKTLSDGRANCKCLSIQKPVLNRLV
jgi:hypothetical protein